MLILWLLSVVFYSATIASAETLCRQEVSYFNQTRVVWPTVKSSKGLQIDYAISNPPCFGSEGDLIIRQCKNKTWYPTDPPYCVFERSNTFCPKELVELIVEKRVICLKISDPQPWNDEFCYGSDKTLFDLSLGEQIKILNYLGSKHDTTRIWLPAGRYTGEGAYDPVVWRLPGKEWGELVKEKYDEVSSGQCLSTTLYMDYTVTNCSEHLRNVCVFKKDLVVASSCPENHAAMSYGPTNCYGIAPMGNDRDVHFLKYFKNGNILNLKHIFKYLDVKEQQCLVERFQLKQWNGTIEDLSVVFNPEKCDDFFISRWPIDDCRLSHVILEPTIPIQMFLTFSAAHDTLVLTVYNRKHIWREDKKDFGIKCFTNADYELIHSVKIKDLIWEDPQQMKSLFELKLYGDGPGYYWCEAHSIFNFELIQAPRIVATKKRKGHPFAFIFEMPCSVEECSNFSHKMKRYGKRVEKILNEIKHYRPNRRRFKPIVIHNVRVMSIEAVYTGTKMRFLCHATVSLKDSSVDNSSEEDSEEEEEIVEANGIRHETAVRSKLRDMLDEMLRNYTYYIPQTSVNSTQYCFPEPFSSYTTNNWRTAKIGQSSTTYDLCLMLNGLPVARKCIGDFLYGAIWEPSNQNLRCIKHVQEDVITTNLFKIERNNLAKQDPIKLINDVKELMDKTVKFIPADLFFLGQIMQSIANNIIVNRHSNDSSIFVETFKVVNNTQDILNIYNFLMGVDQNIAKMSTVLNSTNVLLEAFEKIIDQIAISEDSQNFDAGNNEMLHDGPNGVKYEISPKLMVFRINPNVSGISGVAIYTNSSNDLDFTNASYKFLYANQSKSELLREDNLEIAAFAPQTLLDRLDEITITNTDNVTVEAEHPPPVIIIKIYFNDRLFQEDKEVTDKRVFGKIISISIPGYERDLPEPFPIYIRSNVVEEEENGTVSTCRYWNYSSWAEDGLYLIERSSVSENLSLFGTTHLTPFAYLVGGTYNLSVSADVVIITKIHEEALDIITLLGCSLSLIGTIGIVLTAITFQTWREKPSSKVLLQLSAAIALQMILFCFVNTDVLTTHLLENHIYSSCIALGTLLHYSVLVQFSWMLIVAFLQYKRYVIVIGKSRPTRFFLKAFLLGWGVPLVPVLIVVLINKDAYIPIDNPDNSKICYPAGQALYFGVILPIVLIIIANLIIFVLVIYHIVKGPDGMNRKTERKIALAQLRISILLFFLLGFTWIFGLLAAMRAGLLFSYLFCLTATLQGFVLFIYFVVLDPTTRKLWSNLIRTSCCNKDAKQIN